MIEGEIPVDLADLQLVETLNVSRPTIARAVLAHVKSMSPNLCALPCQLPPKKTRLDELTSRPYVSLDRLILPCRGYRRIMYHTTRRVQSKRMSLPKVFYWQLEC